jgi:hypothetical protein
MAVSLSFSRLDRWNGVSKERSSRRAPIRKQATRKRERTRVDGQNAETKLIGQTQEGYRELARSEVLAAWPQILEGLIEKAMGGGYQHAKLLLDLCELAGKEPHKSDKRPSEQLCDALLNNLQLRPPE